MGIKKHQKLLWFPSFLTSNITVYILLLLYVNLRISHSWPEFQNSGHVLLKSYYFLVRMSKVWAHIPVTKRGQTAGSTVHWHHLQTSQKAPTPDDSDAARNLYWSLIPKPLDLPAKADHILMGHTKPTKQKSYKSFTIPKALHLPIPHTWFPSILYW